MGLIEKIKSFFNKIFKKDSVEKLNPAQNEEITATNENYNQTKEKKDIFIKSLKIASNKKFKKIETIECVGDGLGFKNKMEY